MQESVVDRPSKPALAVPAHQGAREQLIEGSDEDGIVLGAINPVPFDNTAHQLVNGDVEAQTAGGRNMHLRIAVDYSSRDAILRAAAKTKDVAAPLTRERFARLLADVDHDPAPVRDVDLLIRTGGEQRLSDFLLWECAYAELYFTDRRWPDFTAADLEQAVAEFHSRERRFGTVPEAAAG